MRQAPTNSLGAPWRGERWRCRACGAEGDDRDDCRDMPAGCPKHPSAAGRGPCDLEYAPASHHVAVRGMRR